MGIITSCKDFMNPRRFRQGPPDTHESASDRSDVLGNLRGSAGEYAASADEGTEELRKNQETEPFFRQWCLEIVAGRGEVLLKTIVAGVAELFDCSTTTTTRYLKKLTSELGPLRIRRNSARQSVVVLEENHEFNIEESPN